MPDVGVLNLTIRDNSTEAADGLSKLARQLKGVKTAAEGYNLSAVSTQIKSLVDTVKGSENSAKSLGTLMNAVSDYHKTFAKFGNVKMNLEPIAKIKAAIGDGINIGNAGTQLNKIREAMSGEWNTANAESAATVLKTIANGAKELSGAGLNAASKDISALAKSIEELNTAVGNIQGGGMESLSTAMSGGISEASNVGANMALGVQEGFAQQRDALISSAIEMVTGAVAAMKQAMAIHSPSGVTESKVGEPMGQGVAEGLQATEGEIQSAGVEVIQNAVDAMRTTAEQSTIDLSAIPAMSANSGFKNIAEEIKHVTDALAKSKQDITDWSNTYEEVQKRIKYNGATEEQTNMLGHAEEGFYAALEQAEAYESTLSNIKGYIQDYVSSEHAAAQAASAHAESLVKVNSAIQTSSDTMKSSQRAAKGYYASLEDAYKGIRNGEVVKNDLMSGWLHGEGTQGEQLYALKTMAQQFGMTVDEVKQKLTDLQAAEQSLSGTRSIDIDQFIEAYDHVSYLKNEIVDLKSQLKEKVEAGTISNAEIDQAITKINKLTNEYNQLIEAQAKAKNESLSLSFSFGDLKAGIQNMFPTITGLMKRFTSMMKMRAIRYLIRQIAAGFKEGIQNVYEYSKAVGGSFAPTMDSAASAVAQMKNSLGAALAPALQALIPIINTVVSWFITLINYINQFFALLGGQTSWLRASPQTVSAFDKQKKAAGGASAAMKDLLADWDELNIIQSESGGGGGGGGSGISDDYLNMFEKVDEFDSKIKKIVNWIKDNFEFIKTIAEKIGAAILLWKVATAFAETISLLSSLAALALIPLEFDLSYTISKEYFKTGNDFYLLADFLQTLLGAVIMRKILNLVAGGSMATIAIPLMFAVSAAATIAANVTETDVSALSEESLKADLLSALEGGVAAGYLAHMVGGSIGESILGGVVGAIATFGIAIGLKADAEVTAEGITPDTVKAKLISIGSLGLSGAAIAAKMGGGLAGMAGMSMLFMGAPVATFGVALGINAVNEAVSCREITPSVIRKNITSAALVGTGLALGTIALAGGGVVAGLVAAAGGAIVTLAALFGIEAYILSEEVSVQWGDYEATKEEIESFVNEEIFKAAPTIEINLANAKFEELGENKKQLQEDAEKVLGTLKAAKIGIAENASDTLKADLETFIATFNKTTKNYQEELQIAVSLVPVGNGKEDTNTLINNSSARWDELNNTMAQLATDLAKQFDIAYDESLDETVRKDAELSIEKISNMMTQIANAISAGTAKAKIAHNLNQHISEMSHESMDELITYYESQREELIEKLTKANEDAAEGLLTQYYTYEELANYALKEAGGDITDKTYKHWKEQADKAYTDYRTILDELKERATEEADKVLSGTEGYNKIRESLLGLLKNVDKDNIEKLLAAGAAGDFNLYGAFINSILNGAEEGNASKELEYFFDNVLAAIVGDENYDTFKKGIDDGFIKYSDIFDKELVEKLIKGLKIPDEGPIRDAVNTILSQIFPEYYEAPIETKLKLVDGVEGAFGLDGAVDKLIEEDPLEEAEEYVKSALISSFDDKEMFENWKNLFKQNGYGDVVQSVVDDLENSSASKNATETVFTVVADQAEAATETVEELVEEVENLKNTVTTYDGYTFDDSTLEGVYKHLNWQLATAGFEGGNRQPFQNVIEELKKSGSIDMMNWLKNAIEENGINTEGVVEAFRQLDVLMKSEFEDVDIVTEPIEEATEAVEELTEAVEKFDDATKEQLKESISNILGIAMNFPDGPYNFDEKVAEYSKSFGDDFVNGIVEELRQQKLRNSLFDEIEILLTGSTSELELNNAYAELGSKYGYDFIDGLFKEVDEYLVIKKFTDALEQGYTEGQFNDLFVDLGQTHDLDALYRLYEEAQKLWEEQQLNGGAWGKFGNPMFVTAGMGVSDVGYNTPKQYVVPVNESEDKETNIRDISNDVQAGVSAANGEQNSLFNTMIGLLQRIAAKDLSVTITPTSSAGAWAGASSRMFERVTGG